MLKDLVYAYNHSYHRSIKMRPIDVVKRNQNTVFFNLYGFNLEEKNDYNFKISRIKFKIGEFVRISKYKFKFSKGYTPNWTTEIFRIKKVLLRDIPVYRIEDQNLEEIEGIFYDSELQKVS